MSDPVNVTCPKCSSGAGDQCRDRYARARPFCKERERAAALHRPSVAAPAPVPVPTEALKADDFDEATPPPRTRPRGAPLPREVTLPPGEDLVGIFAQWDREGRVPAGAILCESRALDALTHGGPQYKVLAGDADARDLDAFKVIACIRREPSPARRWCIMAPIGGVK